MKLKSDSVISCPVCKTEYDIAEIDECPVCNWYFQGYEYDMDDDEKCPYHLMTLREAKKRYNSGLDIWGNPLPKKN